MSVKNFRAVRTSAYIFVQTELMHQKEVEDIEMFNYVLSQMDE